MRSRAAAIMDGPAEGGFTPWTMQEGTGQQPACEAEDPVGNPFRSAWRHRRAVQRV